MKIAESRTRSEFPLSEKKMMKKTLTGIIFSQFLIFFILLFVFAAAVPVIMALRFTLAQALPIAIIFVLMLEVGYILWIYIMQRLYFASYYYEVDEDLVVIRKGVFASTEITIPYERIQDVYMDQDVFDRIFGLYDVHLSSATASSAMEAHVDGLEVAAANGLRDRILSHVKNKNKKK